MNTIDERIAALLVLINTALDAADFDDREHVTVTSDGRDVPKAFSLAAGAVVVYPMPAIDWLAPKTAQLTWSIAVLSTDMARTKDIVAALYEGRVFRFGDKGSVTDFQMPDSQTTIPGYTISHIEEHRS